MRIRILRLQYQLKKAIQLALKYNQEIEVMGLEQQRLKAQVELLLIEKVKNTRYTPLDIKS